MYLSFFLYPDTNTSSSEKLKYPSVGTLVLPKIHSVRDLHYVSRTIRNSNPSSIPLRIVASIESARSVIGLGDIASWRSEFGAEKGGKLTALLVSCESALLFRSTEF